MNDKQKLLVISNLKNGELKLYDKLLDSPSREGFVNGEHGAFIASLQTKKVAEKSGKVGRVHKWKVTEPFTERICRKFLQKRLWMLEI